MSGQPLDAMPLDDVEPVDDVPYRAPLGEPGPRVVRIEFDGNALFAAGSLKVLMRTKEGQRLDPVAFNADLEQLFRYFEDVRVVQEDVPGGIVLRFLVSENPLVVALNIYGNDEFEEAEIREMMSTREGYPLFPYDLASDAEDIVEQYRLRGFHFAHVPEPVVETVTQGGRRVDFTVVEGPQVEIEKILFRGNAHISRSDLLDAMRSSEEGPIPFLDEALFRMDVLLEDLVAVKRRYEEDGYLDAEVVLDDLKFSDDKERVILTIAIDEHQVYTVGTLDIVIERVESGEPGQPSAEDLAYFTEARIQEWLGLTPGGPYSALIEEKGRKKIQEEYFRRSYIDAVVEPGVRRGRERALVVDLEVKIEEGPKSRLRRLDFYGNEYTRDRVLRREARVSPGGYVDSRELDRTLARLRSLGYFERVRMDVRDVIGPDGQPLVGWKDARYEVIEGSTGKLNFGVGLSTDGGFLGSISFRKRNFDITRWPRSFSELLTRRAFTGAGQNLDIFVAPSTRESQFAISFTEPHFFGTDLWFNVQGYKRLGFWESYETDRTGYGVGLRHPIYKDSEDTVRITAGLNWRHELVNISDVDDLAVPGIFLFRGESEVRSLIGSITLRTIDDVTKPTWQTTTRLRAELAGTFLGGDLDMLKLDGLHEQTILVHEDDEGRRQRLTVRGNVGYSEALEDTSEVPPFERFYAGGNTLRGFAYRGVGPMANNRPMGGEWMVTHAVEYEYPIVPRTLGVVAFLDGGTVGTNVHEADAFRWRLSAGVGLRLVLPMLGSRPLAFDFGFPFLYEDEDERTVVSFSLGRDF